MSRKKKKSKKNDHILIVLSQKKNMVAVAEVLEIMQKNHIIVHFWIFWAQCVKESLISQKKYELNRQESQEIRKLEEKILDIEVENEKKN